MMGDTRAVTGTDHEAEAVNAAAAALAKQRPHLWDVGFCEFRALARAIIAAVEPHLAAAERGRLADRQQMVDEVRAELDDAFQFTERDGSRHGYVTREWVQVLIATQAASAGAAEREQFRTLVTRWREAADSLASSNPAWSSHFYDSANELEALIDGSST